jgi:hypothetical protein
MIATIAFLLWLTASAVLSAVSIWCWRVIDRNFLAP